MRTFIAIELSEDIKAALARVESHLKYFGADVKWVGKNNIHLTIKFLGEITEEKCEKVKAALDEAVKAVAPFEISMKDIGAFPNIDFPRVIWAGIDKGAKESFELAGRIDEMLSIIGFDKDARAFAAHLTIGRVRSAKNKEALKENLTKHPPEIARVHLVSSVVLFQSELTPTGSIYTRLHEAKFAK